MQTTPPTTPTPDSLLDRSPRLASRTMTIIGIAAAVLSPLLFGARAEAIDTGGVKENAGAYLGINSAGLARIQRKQEEGLVSCMKKQGFEYFSEGLNVPSDALDGGTSNRKAFVDKYGYGISTLIEPPKKGTKNKNAAYVEKLSASDKRAYNVALLGSAAGDVSNIGLDTLNAKSCIAVVTQQVYGELSKLQGVIAKYEEVQKRVSSNTAVVKAMRDWSGCMKTGGYTYAKDTDVEPDISAKVQKLYSGPATPLGPDPSTVDVAGLAKLKKIELQTAKADWDCSKKHLGPRDKISNQLEKEFIEKNRAQLDQLKKVFSAK